MKKNINVDLSKPAFRDHMIVRLSSTSCGELLALSTFEPRRGHSSTFYLNALGLASWINDSRTNSIFKDADFNSFVSIATMAI